MKGQPFRRSIEIFNLIASIQIPKDGIVPVDGLIHDYVSRGKGGKTAHRTMSSQPISYRLAFGEAKGQKDGFAIQMKPTLRGRLDGCTYLSHWSIKNEHSIRNKHNFP